MKKHALWITVAAFSILFVQGTIQAQPVGNITPGLQVRTTAPATGGSIEFTLYAPPTYDNNGTKRWPLIIQMPPMGATIEGAGGAGFAQLISCGIPQELKTPANCKYVSDRFIVVSPFLHNNNYPANYVPLHNWIKHLYKTYKIDSTCVSFYGTCWGGNTSWGYFMLHPEIPSAAYLFAINDGWSATLDLTKACSLKNVGIRIVRGLSDCCSPLGGCQAVANALHACGTGNDTFIQIPGPHEVYNFMDTISGMYDWFLTRKTTPTATAAIPQINPAGEYAANELPPQILATELSASDRMEVLDINGQMIFNGIGSGLTVKQMLPDLYRGLYLIRIRGSQSVARMFLQR